MARVVNFFKGIATHPMETIEFVVPLLLFFSGLWATCYAPYADIPTLRDKPNSTPWLIAIFGVIQLTLAGPLLYAIAHKTWTTGIKLRRWLSFVCFVLLLFYGITGVLVNGLDRISWLSSFGFAVIAGVCHVRLRWEHPNA